MMKNKENVKILTSESGLTQNIWVGPIYDKPTPRSMWRIYLGPGGSNAISFSKSTLKVWGLAIGLTLDSLQKWVEINYEVLIKIFNGKKKCSIEDFKKDFKKELRRI